VDSLVSLYRATQQRLQGDDATAVIASLLAKPRDYVLVRALAIIFGIAQAQPDITPLDLLDRAIAVASDLERSMAVDDPNLQRVADYLVGALNTIPQPIPRTLLQSLGVALVKQGTYPSRSDAVAFLLDTYTFEP
jgi:hypothetical protein